MFFLRTGINPYAQFEKAFVSGGENYKYYDLPSIDQKYGEF